MSKTSIKGMDQVLKNLNSEIRKIEGASLKGLIQAAIIIRRDMDQTPPMIPIDTGNLRGSWTVETIRSVSSPAIRLGFTSYYAWFVHEMVGANFQRPGAGAKFFEAALKNNRDNILNAIRREAGLR